MPFKKLHPHIKEVLLSLNFDVATPFQKASIPIIKSGANLYGMVANGGGKTTTMILTTLHKLKCQEIGSAPRALILVENNEKVLALQEAFLPYVKRTDLRLYACDDREHIDLLKSEIFEGVDILIATPKTVNQLLLLEGLNTTQLKILNIDDADFLVDKAAYTALLAITQSIHKCQYVVYAEKMHPILKRLESYFMAYSKKITIK